MELLLWMVGLILIGLAFYFLLTKDLDKDKLYRCIKCREWRPRAACYECGRRRKCECGECDNCGVSRQFARARGEK